MMLRNGLAAPNQVRRTMTSTSATDTSHPVKSRPMHEFIYDKIVYMHFHQGTL
jgi:hypothetical protein